MRLGGLGDCLDMLKLADINKRIYDLNRIRRRWIKSGTYPEWLDSSQDRLLRIKIKLLASKD